MGKQRDLKFQVAIEGIKNKTSPRAVRASKKLLKKEKRRKTSTEQRRLETQGQRGVSSAHVGGRSGPGRGASAIRFLILASYENSFDWLARRVRSLDVSLQFGDSKA